MALITMLPPVLVAVLVDLHGSGWLGWLMLCSAALLGSAIAYIYGAFIAKPVQMLINDAHALSAGVSGHRSMIPPVGEIGELAKALNQMADTMEQRNNALADSERRYRLLFDSNPFPMWAWDADSGSILAVNEAAVDKYGYEREQFLNMQITDLLDDSERDRFNSARLPFKESRQDAGTWIHRTADGRQIEMEVVTTSSRRLGRPGWLSVGIDVTARREAERALARSAEQLKQVQKMEAIGTFADGISHDFNNILTALLGYCDLLSTQLEPDSVAGQQLNQIQSLAIEGTDLSRQILAMSRTAVTRPALLDPSSVVLGLDPVLRRLTGQGIALHTHVEESAGCVRADVRQLEQAIISLVSNARDALDDGGQIDIRVMHVTPERSKALRIDPNKNWTSISVSDNGSGMSEEVQARIFEPFFTTRKEAHRTGLGLVHTSNMVARSDGVIRVTSTPGTGTTIHLILPRVDERVRAVSAAPKTQEQPEQTKGYGIILLAEDEEAVRSIVAAVLERSGYQVLAAANGSDAIELYHRQGGGIDLLITDVVMPGMNGCILAARLQKERPALPVLFVSGYTEEDVLREGISTNPGSLLAKPFTAQELTRRVRMMLQSS